MVWCERLFCFVEENFYLGKLDSQRKSPSKTEGTTRKEGTTQDCHVTNIGSDEGISPIDKARMKRINSSEDLRIYLKG